MKIIIRGVLDMTRPGCPVLEEDSYEYEGPIACAKSGGSAPQPVDPWQQAAAQYGLSTGTAAYNAGLNRTNQVNPLGGSYWSSTGGGGSPMGSISQSAPAAGGSSSFGGTGPFGVNNYYGNPTDSRRTIQPISPGGSIYGFGGAPATWTQTTQLDPQFQSELQKPIDTSGIAGMPGGPSTTADLANTRDALYKQQMAFLQPEQALQSEQTDSRLANMGATMGSPAWNTEQDRLAREQEFARGQARTAAITGGGQEQSRLFGLGSQALQNQIGVRNAPISEYNALSGQPGATATALTPDISGAFGQQYQGALAGYNANVASDNANTSGIGSLILAAAMYF